MFVRGFPGPPFSQGSNQQFQGMKVSWSRTFHIENQLISGNSGSHLSKQELMSDFISKTSCPLHLQSNVMHVLTSAILLVPNANCVPKKREQPFKVGGPPALCDAKG